VRFGVLATVVAFTTPAVADPADRLELTGFLGVEDFSEDNGLGNALAPEQRPQTAPMFGARITYIALQTSGELHLDLGGEAELSFAPAWTGYGFESARPSYFAPVFGYRANLMLRLGGSWLQPHVLGGVGAASVASESPLMQKETDPVFVWGVGATIAMGRDGWQLRLDGRQVLTESMSGDTTSNYELLVGVGFRFGAKPAAPVIETQPPPVDVIVAKPPEVDKDSDNDGVLDKLDRCPQQPELVNGFDDQDGCPEPDPDGDQNVTGLDKCPDKAEDVDKFEDDDGCPDDDNDKDGVADAADKCRDQAETKNGFNDEDGCPDALTPAIVEGLASASKAAFDPARPRLTSRAKSALDRSLPVMLSNPKLKILITLRPEQDGDKHVDIAKKRADNVKWYLVEQGVSAGSLTTAVGPVADKKGPVLVLSVAP
jgi:OOP family OmpA-OmpF porin